MTEFGALWPVWNLSTATMVAPNLEDIYRTTNNPPWQAGSEYIMMPLACPHPSTPSTITAGAQPNFALKDTGMICMRGISSNIANLTDVLQDWTGFIPLVKNKFRAHYKLHMLATLTTVTDWTSIGSYWMRIMLFNHSNKYFYSGYRSPSYTGAGPLTA